MTQEEARMKWCPHAVASHTDPRGRMGYERPELGLPAETFIHACIGSACMAWRWRPIPNPEWSPINPMSYPQRNPYSAAPAAVASTTDGYCGLAGGDR